MNTVLSGSSLPYLKLEGLKEVFDVYGITFLDL